MTWILGVILFALGMVAGLCAGISFATRCALRKSASDPNIDAVAPPVEKTILVCRSCGKPSKRKIGKNTYRRCNYCHGKMIYRTGIPCAPPQDTPAVLTPDVTLDGWGDRAAHVIVENPPDPPSA